MPFVSRPDGCRLYYELHGPSSGSPLLLLEGMGGDIPGWRRNIPTLADRRRVIAYDFRGNGRSDKPDRPMTVQTLVDDTVALLDELGARRAHVYGQSLGGMVAQELALAHPDRVRSLVLACTHAGERGAAKLGPEANVPKERPHEALYSRRFVRDHPQHVAEDLAVGRRNPQPRHAGRRQWEAVRDWDAWDRIAAIRCPTLVLHGTDDRVISVENARMLAERIPGAELRLLEGAGHVYHSERPEEADRAVLEFLDRAERQ